MDDEKQYPAALVELFDLIMTPTASAGVELVKRLEPVFRDADRYRKLRDGQNWPAAFARHDAPEPLRGVDLDAALDGAA